MSAADESILATGVVFRTGDLEIALDFRGSPGKTHAAQRRFKRHNIRKYSEEVQRIDQLPVFGQGRREEPTDETEWRPPGPVAEDEGGTGGWESYTLEDLLYLCFFHYAEQLLDDPALMASLHGSVLSNEFAAHGKIPDTSGVGFGDYLVRFFRDNREPYVAVVAQEAVDMPLAEQWEQSVPDRVTISDSPALVHEIVQRRMLPLGGVLRLITFRSFIQPAMERLREWSKQKDRLPSVTAYTGEDSAMLQVSHEEGRFLSLVRNTKNLNPDVRLKQKGGRIQEVEYVQAWTPGSLRPVRTLAEKSTVSITSLPDENGELRNYTVKKRLTF